jgi:hypothetical protein
MTKTAESQARIISTPKIVPIVEMREARRAALMIRAAKLVCLGGEYVAVIRDVSESGLRLRLFHPLPPEPVMLLELGNLDTFPIEPVWSKQIEEGVHEVGFRFAYLIDMDDFIEEPCDFARRQLRLRLRIPGQMIARGESAPIELRDLSQSGVRVECGGRFSIHEAVRLEIPGMPVKTARVRWRNGRAHGLVFDRPLRLEELAQHALALQPFGEVAEDEDGQTILPLGASSRARA